MLFKIFFEVVLFFDFISLKQGFTMKPMVASSSRVPGLQSATMCFRHVLDKCKGREGNVPFVPICLKLCVFGYR